MRINIPPSVLKACEILSDQDYQAFLVGGAIRDSYLGLHPTDWDIATDAAPNVVQSIFDHSIPTGKQFGTITVLVQGESIEITTMRSDGPYSDSRHPDYVAFTDQIVEDLSRRDFTINALAYDPLNQKTVDPFSGVKHLRKKLLVAVGRPMDRFREDPLRMLRLVRFQAALGFKIDKKIRLALPELAPLLTTVSPERILSEFNKMLLGKELYSALETLYTSGLLEEIIPELATAHGVSPGGRHPYDLLGHVMISAHFAQPKLELRWAALLHDVGKLQSLKRDHAQISAEVAEGILGRLRASNELIEKVARLISHHMFSVHPHSSDREIRRFLAKVGVEGAYDLVKLRQADLAGMNVNPRDIVSFGGDLVARFDEILAGEHALSVKELSINGHDLLHGLNLQPGPTVGKVLQHLLEQVLEDPSLNEPTILLELARIHLKSLQQSQN